MIDYRRGNQLDLDAVIDLYIASTLGERRPVDDRERMATMLAQANLVISAWEQGQLVGIARSMSDFVYATYLSDLAVDADYQRQGIGRQLIVETRQRLQPECKVVLIAAPAANDYYPKLGFEHNPRAWILPGRE